MANIEIRGFGLTLDNIEKPRRLRDRINTILTDMPDSSDEEAVPFITTIVPSEARNCDGDTTDCPYLRVYSDDPDELDIVMTTLCQANIGVEIEGVLLTRYLPVIDDEVPTD